MIHEKKYYLTVLFYLTFGVSVLFSEEPKVEKPKNEKIRFVYGVSDKESILKAEIPYNFPLIYSDKIKYSAELILFHGFKSNNSYNEIYPYMSLDRNEMGFDFINVNSKGNRNLIGLISSAEYDLFGTKNFKFKVNFGIGYLDDKKELSSNTIKYNQSNFDYEFRTKELNTGKFGINSIGYVYGFGFKYLIDETFFFGIESFTFRNPHYSSLNSYDTYVSSDGSLLNYTLHNVYDKDFYKNHVRTDRMEIGYLYVGVMIH
ncbi:hypothetical protein [Leptospira kmetyi]|uniref:Outer membrane protein beta-barrel domain-containing protein n=1 Tax=Leptospira kmetyi TaxID=408139 RepID=A0ABX4N995_9LEPT|nr:hypothetical protein [Leptospira kmetyi]PJZ29506.1 hypothetical protein CH378_12540 [Leptospira kmetyi]